LRSRAGRFAVFASLTVLLAAGYVAWSIRANRADAASAGITIHDGATVRHDQVLFRSMLTDGSFGKVAVTPIGGSRTEWRLSDLKCDRVYYAGGRGICLAASSLGPVSVAKIFGSDFHVQHEVHLAGGVPSRVRVSPDGRYGSTTNFVYGHSYSDGSFSTQTTLIDLDSGTKIADLEQFTVRRDGVRFKRRDFNFWGVTFARGSDRFYATLGTGGETFLVAGDVRARSMRVLRENVECPSLSPDGTRIAFKKKLHGNTDWHVTVLDLATMKEHALAEPERVDDQVEWLDARHVVYWRANTIWVVPANGSGHPARFVADAFSPSVIR
jgi:WD40-like Beta Propeller Repeat